VAPRCIVTQLSAPVTETSHRRRALAIGLVSSTSLVAFETTSLLTALPTIADDLVGDSLYGATLSAYMLASIVGLVSAGERADRSGPRAPFVVCIAIFLFGLVVASLAPSMTLVLVGRILQGVGAGGIAPITFVIIKRVWPEDQRSRIFAWVSAGWVLPSLIAPGLAGYVTRAFGWRWVFIGIAPIALATAVLSVSAMGSLRSTDESKAHAQTQKSRLPQAILLTAGVAFFIAGLQTKFVLLAIAFIGLGLILAIPNFNKLMPPDIWRAKRGLSAILACRMLATAAFLSIDSFVPLAADRIHGASATIQGFVIIGAALESGFGSFHASLPYSGGAFCCNWICLDLVRHFRDRSGAVSKLASSSHFLGVVFWWLWHGPSFCTNVGGGDCLRRQWQRGSNRRPTHFGRQFGICPHGRNRRCHRCRF
jgi:MFS family permease